MDYLQYFIGKFRHCFYDRSFKPYYKWITFNIDVLNHHDIHSEVLNLIINGLPSISCLYILYSQKMWSFKPYYKWITFNIIEMNDGRVIQIEF